MTCADLVDELPGVWKDATEHPFLATAAAGQTGPFARWLPQDIAFVTDLIVFQSRLVARAPRSAKPVLAGGVVAILAELDWFDDLALALDLPSSAPTLPATADYRELLVELDQAPYPAAIVGLWVLEQVYLEGWRYADRQRSDDRYAAAIEHWTDPAFAAYVTGLEAAADEALSDPAVDLEVVRETVRRVLGAEIAFWEMAFGDAP